MEPVSHLGAIHTNTTTATKGGSFFRWIALTVTFLIDLSGFSLTMPYLSHNETSIKGTCGSFYYPYVCVAFLCSFYVFMILKNTMACVNNFEKTEKNKEFYKDTTTTTTLRSLPSSPIKRSEFPQNVSPTMTTAPLVKHVSFDDKTYVSSTQNLKRTSSQPSRTGILFSAVDERGSRQVIKTILKGFVVVVLFLWVVVSLSGVYKCDELLARKEVLKANYFYYVCRCAILGALFMYKKTCSSASMAEVEDILYNNHNSMALRHYNNPQNNKKNNDLEKGHKKKNNFDDSDTYYDNDDTEATSSYTTTS